MLEANICARRLVDFLVEQGIRVERFLDHFDQHTIDPDWIEESGRRGWFALTADQRIRWRKAELRAVRDSQLGMFVLTSGVLGAKRLVEVVTVALPHIRRVAQSEPRPFLARISKSGGVYLWLRSEGIKRSHTHGSTIADQAEVSASDVD